MRSDAPPVALLLLAVRTSRLPAATGTLGLRRARRPIGRSSSPDYNPSPSTAVRCTPPVLTEDLSPVEQPHPAVESRASHAQVSGEPGGTAFFVSLMGGSEQTGE